MPLVELDKGVPVFKCLFGLREVDSVESNVPLSFGLVPLEFHSPRRSSSSGRAQDLDFFAGFLRLATEYSAIRSARREMSLSSATRVPLPGGGLPSMYSRKAWLIWVWYGAFPRLAARALKKFRMSLSIKMVMRTLVYRSIWSNGGRFRKLARFALLKSYSFLIVPRLPCGCGS